MQQFFTANVKTHKVGLRLRTLYFGFNFSEVGLSFCYQKCLLSQYSSPEAWGNRLRPGFYATHNAECSAEYL